MLEQVIKFFVVFFVVVEPLSLAPVFASLTEGANDPYKRKMSLKAALVAAGILLLFLMALEMVFARESGTRTSSDEQAESKRRADISVFPLAFPLLAGPGALTTILLWFGPVLVTEQPVLFSGLIAAAFAVIAVSLLMMRLAGPIMRIMGVTGANVTNRLLGVVLGALAVQFVLDGVRAAFKLLG